MPALIPVHNTLGALFIGTVLSSMLVDSANLVIVIYTTYQFGVTNFGDYLSDASKPPECSTFSCRAQGGNSYLTKRSFYAYRIYHLSGGSPLPASSHLRRLIGIFWCWGRVLYKNVLCDVFITSGMVYYLLSNRTQFRRTNNVLNLLAIYSINCGILHLAFAISSVALLAKYRDTLINTPSLFIMYRLSLCAFMAILNSRDNLRETLNGQDDVVATLTQLKAHTGQGAIGTQDTTEVGTNTAVPKGLPLHSVYSNTSLSSSVVAFDRENYAVPPVVAI
ncbi:hypothetical protein EDB86DRAFT_2827641 [Lactarius hatsudake]|nr:hypothetical protein EDB86DRAFT_2827641 [Lactarius hatsudake]